MIVNDQITHVLPHSQTIIQPVACGSSCISDPS